MFVTIIMPAPGWATSAELTHAQVCPGCIFLVEGGGQANYCSTNWGNGFATSPAVTSQNGVSDATPFFQAVLNQPWLSQVSCICSSS